MIVPSPNVFIPRKCSHPEARRRQRWTLSLRAVTIVEEDPNYYFGCYADVPNEEGKSSWPPPHAGPACPAPVRFASVRRNQKRSFALSPKTGLRKPSRDDRWRLRAGDCGR